MTERLVVGISGQPSGEAALEWALDYAAAHHADIELVHVVDDKWPSRSKAVTGEAFLRAEQELRDAAERAVERFPGLRVHPDVAQGSPIDALVARAADADLLVVGTHTLHRFEGLVFSTRAAHAAALAAGSVVVVPEGRPLAGDGVVVGVDGSASSVAAVEFAAREADRLGQSLRAVFAWRAVTPWTTVDDDAENSEPTDNDRLLLSEAVAGLPEEYPDLRVDLELSRSLPADALVDAAAGARLLVVGTHGRHGITKLWLGSVGHELILAMPCPVAVLKPPATAP